MSPYRAISADLWFANAREDLATVFVDCLVRLPNLRTLDILITSRVNIVNLLQELKRECARFPSIRELWMSNELAGLIGNCPNAESITFVRTLRDTGIPHLRGKRLRRVARMCKAHVQHGELRVSF